MARRAFAGEKVDPILRPPPRGCWLPCGRLLRLRGRRVGRGHRDHPPLARRPLRLFSKGGRLRRRINAGKRCVTSAIAGWCDHRADGGARADPRFPRRRADRDGHAGDLAVSIVSLSSLSIFLVPLIALLLSFDAIVGAVDRGTLALLLAYPVARWLVVLASPATSPSSASPSRGRLRHPVRRGWPLQPHLRTLERTHKLAMAFGFGRERQRDSGQRPVQRVRAHARGGDRGDCKFVGRHRAFRPPRRDTNDAAGLAFDVHALARPWASVRAGGSHKRPPAVVRSNPCDAKPLSSLPRSRPPPRSNIGGQLSDAVDFRIHVKAHCPAIDH